MKQKYILLFFISMFGLNGCHANEVIAKLTDVNVHDDEIFVNFEIRNLSKNEVFIDKIYLSSAEGVLVHNVLEVIELHGGKEKSVRYKGMFRDYSEFHDFTKSAVSILPGKVIAGKIDISSHYSLSDSGVYKVRYGAIVKNIEGKSMNVVSDFVKVSASKKN